MSRKATYTVKNAVANKDVDMIQWGNFRQSDNVTAFSFQLLQLKQEFSEELIQLEEALKQERKSVQAEMKRLREELQEKHNAELAAMRSDTERVSEECPQAALDNNESKITFERIVWIVSELHLSVKSKVSDI